MKPGIWKTAHFKALKNIPENDFCNDWNKETAINLSQAYLRLDQLINSLTHRGFFCHSFTKSTNKA